MFLKEIDDNQEAETLSIKGDLTWLQIEANYFLKKTKCFLVLINDLAPEIGHLTGLGSLWKWTSLGVTDAKLKV